MRLLDYKVCCIYFFVEKQSKSSKDNLFEKLFLKVFFLFDKIIGLNRRRGKKLESENFDLKTNPT